MRAVASSEKQGVGPARQAEVVGDVGGRLGRGHRRHGEAQGDALVERGEGAELDAPPEGGRAHQEAGEGGVGVHVGIGQQAELFELVGGQQVGLVHIGSAELRDETYLGFRLQRLVPLRDPNVSLLTATEKEMLDQAIEAMRGLTGSQVSEWSHVEPGWQMVEDNETIPYETAFLRSPVVTEAVRRRVRELAAERSL